jgi:monoamine oxidase
LEEGPVIVLGAGLAGLTAAWRLKQVGREVVVLEATDQVGGRTIRSDDGWGEGQYATLGGEIIDPSYHALRHLAEELGVELSPPQVYGHAEDDDLFTVEGYLRAAQFVVGGRVLSADDRAKVAVELRTAAGDFPPERYEIVEQWVRRARLSADAAGVVRGMARFFTQLDPWDTDVHYVFGAASGTFQRVSGGTVELALALARDLDVRLNQPARRVEHGRRVRVVTESGEEFEGSRLVVAVNPFALPTIGFDPPLSDEKIMTVTSLLPAMAGKVMAQYAEGDAVREVVGSLVVTDGPINAAWVSVTDTSGGPAIVTSFFCGADRHLLEQPDTAFQVLDDLVAQAVGTPVTRLHGEIKNWWKDPVQQGVTVAPSEAARAPIAGILGQIEGWTHFAGDHTDAPMAGTLEGAVRSGLRAADEVLATAPVYHTDFITERLSRA